MENAALPLLVHNAIDGIITIDDYGTIESINHRHAKLFDYTPKPRVIGNNISMLMLSSDRDSHDHHLRNYKTSGRGQYYETLLKLTGRTKDGNQFPF
jgi:PAS domain S-box-containing protein